jgi:hypothetical protein
MQEIEENKLKGFGGEDEKLYKEANIEEITKEIEKIFRATFT